MVCGSSAAAIEPPGVHLQEHSLRRRPRELAADGEGGARAEQAHHLEPRRCGRQKFHALVRHLHAAQGLRVCTGAYQPLSQSSAFPRTQTSNDLCAWYMPLEAILLVKVL